MTVVLTHLFKLLSFFHYSSSSDREESSNVNILSCAARRSSDSVVNSPRPPDVIYRSLRPFSFLLNIRPSELLMPVFFLPRGPTSPKPLYDCCICCELRCNESWLEWLLLCGLVILWELSNDLDVNIATDKFRLSEKTHAQIQLFYGHFPVSAVPKISSDLWNYKSCPVSAQ